MIFRSLERYHTYKPDRTYYEKVDAFDHEIFSIEDSMGHVLDVRFKRLSEDRLILFSHGNKSNISSLDQRYAFFESLGYSYLSYDYPGYGRSTGEPSEEGLYASHHAAIAHAQALGFSLRHIVLHGLSLGGAVAVEGAVMHPGVRSLIVEATFTESHAMAQKIFKNLPVHLFVPNRFCSIERIQDIRCPVLIIHGTEDETTPYEHGWSLHAKAPEPRFFHSVHGAGHTDILEVGGLEYEEAYRSFVESSSIPVPVES